MNMKYPTRYLSVKNPHATKLESFPSAGPNPKITGMRNFFWGKDAMLIKSGQYVYDVSNNRLGQFLYSLAR